MRDRFPNQPCSCGRGCDCGCCEGVEPVTPRPIANRPGLDALSYRIGTHSSFLETMQARLSSQAFPALADLTTREPADVSLALLDAWAVVADVLTFYQERIANEGYLRTATERRSVLELARLVGYVPRPGVAASTYLAYTLEEKVKPVLPPGAPDVAAATLDEPEIVIPAGAAARSVPGPGEMPQTFETTEDLVARAAWNNLQVRLTRPQQTKKLAKDWSADKKAVPLYFKGIATNLKPNDPLLIGTGGAKPDLFRVVKVEADAVKDQTRVDVQLWLMPPPPPSPPPPSASTTLVLAETDAVIAAMAPRETGISAAAALREGVERASDLETLKISRGASARRVLSSLEPVKAALDAGAGEAELREAIEEALPKLREEHAAAVEKNANRLEPWIGGLIADLEGAAAGSPAISAEAPADVSPQRMFQSGGTGADDDEGNGNGSEESAAPPTTSLTRVLESLSKPPQPQVRNAANLKRDAGQLFSPDSDLAARLLSVARPELAGVLYQAWANVPATTAPVFEVCALRTRAAVFGHNAPLEPVRNDDGVIIGGKEWELPRKSGSPGEDFKILLEPSLVGGVLRLKVQITLGSFPLIERPSSPVQVGEETLQYPKATETIQFKIITVPSFSGLPFEFEFRFKNRGLVVTLRGFQEYESSIERLIASSSLPGTVTAKFIPPPPPPLPPPPPVVPIAKAVNLQPFSVVTGKLSSIEVAGTIPGASEDENVLFLDNSYPQIKPADWIVLERPNSNLRGSPLVIAKAKTVKDVSRAAYGITGKSTRVELDQTWLQLGTGQPDTFAVIRGTAVFAQCERLVLAEEPLDPVVEALCGKEIELAGLYDGLQPGRWLVFSGDRTDVGETDEQTKKVIVPVSGVPGAELAMVAGVRQGVSRIKPGGADLPGDRNHTTLTLAKPLAYCYKRDTLRIYGNVAHATHGETRSEVLGSGDASKPHQSFTLKQPPLTWVSAPAPSGIASTLQARVNDVLWHEADCPAGLGPADRVYFVRIDDGGQTTVVFGDGQRGARLPTGAENVRAKYRSGIGKEGNVKAGQISQLATRPLGVKDVINPLPATGGASAESRDQMRRNAPLAVTALDRLVGVQDYAGFARTFAGIGKASAVRLSDGRVQLVHVTIAGEDDIPIRDDSDLFLNLEQALLRFGDPRQPLQLALRERAFLVVQADVRVLPDYLWDTVEPKIRAAMAETFSFARRDLGQDARLSEVYRAIQGVPGVHYVDVNLFAKRDPEDLEEKLKLADQPPSRLPASLARIEKGKIQPAQLLYLTPEVADTLILKELKS